MKYLYDFSKIFFLIELGDHLCQLLNIFTFTDEYQTVYVGIEQDLLDRRPRIWYL